MAPATPISTGTGTIRFCNVHAIFLWHRRRGAPTQARFCLTPGLERGGHWIGATCSVAAGTMLVMDMSTYSRAALICGSKTGCDAALRQHGDIVHGLDECGDSCGAPLCS